jgi:hypothetical protein
MSWFVWLGFAAFVTAVVAVMGMQGKGTRPVAHTSMMGMARFFLMIIIIIFAYLAFHTRPGG